MIFYSGFFFFAQKAFNSEIEFWHSGLQEFFQTGNKVLQYDLTSIFACIIFFLLASNSETKGWFIMPKVTFTQKQQEDGALLKRMDRFDSIVVDYLRKHSYTMESFGNKIGCSATSLWRYRTDISAFKKAPFNVVCNVLRITNASNETIRYICGLPTGNANEK